MAFILIAVTVLLVIIRARRLEPQGIAPLTSLRAFAAAMVFIYHFSENYRADHHPNVLAYFVSGGFEGVSVFFVLSGFLLTLAVLRDLNAHEFSVHQYVVRRLARIYPLYYTLLAVTFLLTPDVIRWQNLVLIQAFFPSVLFTGISTAWTLTVEECFYILLPFVILLCLKVGKSNGLVLACLGLMGTGFFLLALHIPDFMVEPQYLWFRTIFGRFPIFAIGIACAFLYERRKQWPLYLPIISMIVFVAATCLSAAESNFDFPGFRLGDMLIGLATGGIVLGLTSDNRVTRFLGNRYFVYLGLISYALYLVQLTPLMAWLPHIIHTLPDFSAAYAVAILLSMTCYEFVERPARAVILQHFSRLHKTSLVPL